MEKRTVVTIGREFGSGGREIGRKLAQQLGIAFYDKELLALAAEESGMSRTLFESNDEKPISSLLYSLSVNHYAVGNVAGMQSLPINQKLFLAQFAVIRRLAAHDCVIVGRCADYVLRDMEGCVNIFVQAPMPFRVARIKESHELSSGAAKELIIKTDKKRAAYYNSYSDKKWGEIGSYHLSFDSSLTGIEGAVDLIRCFLEMRQNQEQG